MSEEKSLGYFLGAETHSHLVFNVILSLRRGSRMLKLKENVNFIQTIP